MKVTFTSNSGFNPVVTDYLYHEQTRDGSLVFVTRVPENVLMSNNGGDYYQGYILNIDGKLEFNSLLWSDFSDQGVQEYNGFWTVKQ